MIMIIVIMILISNNRTIHPDEMFIVFSCPQQESLGGGFRFQIFFIFTPTWRRFPFWHIFFRWVGSTTNKHQFVCQKNKQDGLAGIDFAMWKLAEVTWTFFLGSSGGEAVSWVVSTRANAVTLDEIQGYHVLGCIIKRCKFHKIPSFNWWRNFLTSRVLDGMFDGYIVYHDDCLSCWTNEDGLLDAELSWRNAKRDICKPYHYSPHFCKTVPNESVPSWWFKAGCNVTSTSGLRRHQHNDYHEFIMTSKNDDHQLNFDEFCNFKSQVTTPPHSSCPSSIVPSPWLCNS